METQPLETTQRTDPLKFGKRHLLIVLALLFVVCLTGAATAKLVQRLRYPPAIRTKPAAAQLANRARFSGAVAMEAVVNGQHDIFVADVSSTPAMVQNVTDSPANETDPDWSPDGDWLAYLSDKSGRPEVYLKRYPDWDKVIQLTSQADIAWSGPLTWVVNNTDGPDMTMGLFAKGTPRASAGETALYYIPASGADHRPVRIDATAGISGTYRIYNNIIDDVRIAAFEKPGGRLALVDLSDHGTLALAGAEAARGLALVPGGFTWLGPGQVFTYLVQGELPDGEVGLEIRKGYVRPTAFRTPAAESSADNGGLTDLYLSARVNAVRGILAGYKYTLYTLQDGQLDGKGADGCLRIHRYTVYDVPIPADHAPLFANLCVDLPAQGFNPIHMLPIESSAHYANYRWMLFTGHAPGESQSGLYAALLFNNSDLVDLDRFYRLPIQLPKGVIPGTVSVRTGGSYLEYSWYGYVGSEIEDVR